MTKQTIQAWEILAFEPCWDPEYVCELVGEGVTVDELFEFLNQKEKRNDLQWLVLRLLSPEDKKEMLDEIISNLRLHLTPKQVMKFRPPCTPILPSTYATGFRYDCSFFFSEFGLAACADCFGPRAEARR